MKRLPCILILSALIIQCAGCEVAIHDQEFRSRPNILLIVVDDMGFSDIGSFGGEIETPNLDRLAYEGIRLTNFHVSPMCSPSRAMLLTGVDSHLAGYGNMFDELAPNQKGKPGYEGYLNQRVVTLPEILADAGYRTYMAGKWHLGSGAGKGPAYRGFDRSFALESGGASHFADMRPAYAPSPDIKAHYSEDGARLNALPDSFHYSSQFYVDRMISYLDEERESGEPFFAYLAFTAPHWPLQAPDEAMARQRGRYDQGYDVVRSQRLARLKAMNLLPDNARLSDRSPKELPWSELDDNQRRREIRAMEIYAAMIDEIDHHVGRLIDFMESSGVLDDTLIVFLSDNGPEGHDLDETWPMEAFPAIRQTIDEVHDFSYEAMGRPGSYVLLGPNWANAGSPPFRLHKGFPTEGGTRVTAFVRYPEIVTQPGIRDEYIFATDLTPTLLRIAGVEHPGTRYEGREVLTPSGRSFDTVLRGLEKDSSVRVTALELLGKRMVRSGRWKLVHMPPPYGTGQWQLFDLEADLAEATDVSAQYPEIVRFLEKEWDQYSEENGVILPNWVSGY